MKTAIRYIVNPPSIQKRVGKKVYDRAGKQIAKWTPVPHGDPAKHAGVGFQGFCGNVRPDWDKEKNRFVFRPDRAKIDWERFPLMSSVISSALLLYRLLCLFGASVHVEPATGSDAHYKCIWWVTLQHKESGEYLEFGEWKGAAGTWTRFHSHKELPASYKRDMLALLNELCSKDCPHPYDGLIAGSVA